MKEVVKILTIFLSLVTGVLSGERNLDGEEEAIQDKYITEIYCHPELRQKAFQMLKDLVDVFSDHEVPYTLLFGSMMGAERHQDMIPWDDDVDLGIKNTDLQKILTLAPLFDAMGYVLKIDGQELVGYKLEDKRSYTTQFADGTALTYRPFIDLFLYQIVGDKYVIVPEKGRNFFPRAWFTIPEFETRKTCSFGPLTVTSLTDMTPLVRQYGTKWSTEAHYYFSHSAAVKTKLRWTLREKDKKPVSLLPLEERYKLYKSQHQ